VVASHRSACGEPAHQANEQGEAIMTNFVHVTRTGCNMLWSRFYAGNATYATVPGDMGWGLGGNSGNGNFGLGAGSAATTDVGLFQEAPESRVVSSGTALTTTTFTNDTLQFIGTLTCTQGGGETISEMGLFDQTTKPFSGTVVSTSTVIASTSGTALTLGANYTPGNSSYVQVDSEVMEVTAGTGGTSLTVTRAANGSAAYAHVAASDVVTAGDAPGSTVVGERMFLHGSFTGLALNNGDSIQFTVNNQLIPS
jgi:hypothetical protein